MTRKKTYQELYDENIKFSDRIAKLDLKIAINKEYMAIMEKQRANDIKTEFFKDKSPVKIKISSAFELNTMAELAKMEPVEFVKKYLNQYKPNPKVMKYDFRLIDGIARGVGKVKKIFISKKAYNAPHNEFITAAFGIIIRTALHKELYDRDWADATITLSFNSDKKELTCRRDESAQIYGLLNVYNREKHTVSKNQR